MATSAGKVTVKVNTSVSKGFSTYLGLISAAIASGGAAVLLALEGIPDDASGAVVIGTLVVAAAAAITKTVDGRMKQAEAIINTQGFGLPIAAPSDPAPAGFTPGQPMGSVDNGEEDPDPDGLPEYVSADPRDVPADQGDVGRLEDQS
jgi:hypothetical protein